MDNAFEQHPGFLIHDTVRLFRQVFGARIHHLGLSEPQWRTLGTVNRHAGIGQTALADVLGIGKAPLGELIDRLEREGLLQRRPHPSDRRANKLYVTAAAQPLTSELRQHYATLEAQFLQDISAAQRRELEQLLIKMLRNLSDTAPPLPVATLGFMHLVSSISNLNNRRFDTRLKELGFTRSQWLVLAGIHNAEGVAQKTLAHTLYMGKVPLGKVIDDLQGQGWVERRIHPKDRRARLLFLTAACHTQLTSLTTTYEHLHDTSVEGFSERQRNALKRLLERVRGNFQSLARATSDSTPEVEPT